jgi:hypothetical protein
VDDGRLRDLEDERLRLELRARERRAHLVHERRRLELAAETLTLTCRPVRPARPRARRELVARLLEDPAPSGTMSPLSSAIGTKSFGGRCRGSGVPTEERLGADDGAGLQVDDRLVVEDELLLDTRAAELAEQREALADRIVERAVVDDDCALPFAFARYIAGRPDGTRRRRRLRWRRRCSP